jgi:hypothetical protein
VTLLGYVQVMVLYVGLVFLGQGVVYLLCFGRHDTNFIYKLFQVVTAPVVKVVRMITPAKVADRHVPVVAFLLLFWAFVALALYIPRLLRVAL